MSNRTDNIGYINQFRYPNTTNCNSVRAYGYTWVGADACAEAVRLLLKGESVELHICDSNHGDLKGDQTHHVMLMSVEESTVQGINMALRTSFDGYADGTLCDGEDPIAMAAHITAKMFAYLKDGHSIYRQPSSELRKELDG